MTSNTPGCKDNAETLESNLILYCAITLIHSCILSKTLWMPLHVRGITAYFMDVISILHEIWLNRGFDLNSSGSRHIRGTKLPDFTHLSALYLWLPLHLEVIHLVAISLLALKKLLFRFTSGLPGILNGQINRQVWPVYLP